MQRARSLLLVMSVGVGVPLTSALAQGVPIQGLEGRTQGDFDQQKAPAYQTTPPPQLSAPGTPRTGTQAVTPSGDWIPIRKIIWTSSGTVVSRQEIEEAVNAFPLRTDPARGDGTGLTSGELVALRDSITRLYVRKGYVTSGAVFGELDPATGTLTIEIKEMDLKPEDIIVDGLAKRGGFGRLDESYVRHRLTLQGPLNIMELNRSFSLLSSDPNIAQIQARIDPHESRELGRARLTANVEQAKAFGLQAQFDNDRSPSVGSLRGSLRGTARNLIGHGDTLIAEVGRTEGLWDADIDFTAPITRRDLTVHLFANGSDAKVIERPLNELDIISKNYTYGGGLELPVWRTFTHRVTIGADISHQYIETSLLDQRFSFSPGAVNGVTDLTVARLHQDLIIQESRWFLAARSTISFGLDATDQLTKSALTPSAHFVSWQGQAQYARLLTDGGQQLSAHFQWQIANGPLWATEKLAFGGAGTVRGYRQNEILSDGGVIASVEYGIPLRSLGIVTGPPTAPQLWDFTLALFADAGWGYNMRNVQLPNDTLVGAGVGLQWQPFERLTARLDWGTQLISVPNGVEKTLQDDGITFRVTSRILLRSKD